MSNFWDNNKGSIMTGLTTAGKYGFQGTKFVAKAGYKAGKQQYNSSKSRRDGHGSNSNDQDNGDMESISSPPPPTTRVADPAVFTPPPLRAGQKQYQGNGVLTEGSPGTNVSPAINSSGNQVAYTTQPSTGYAYPAANINVNMPQTSMEQQWSQRPQPASTTHVTSRPQPFQTGNAAPLPRPNLPSRTQTSSSATFSMSEPSGANFTTMPAPVPSPYAQPSHPNPQFVQQISTQTYQGPSPQRSPMASEYDISTSQGQFQTSPYTQSPQFSNPQMLPQQVMQPHYQGQAGMTAEAQPHYQGQAGMTVEAQPHYQGQAGVTPEAQPYYPGQSGVNLGAQPSINSAQQVPVPMNQTSPYQRETAITSQQMVGGNVQGPNPIYQEPPQHKQQPSYETPIAQGRLVVSPRERIQLSDLTQMAPMPMAQPSSFAEELSTSYSTQPTNLGMAQNSGPPTHYVGMEEQPPQGYSRPAALLPHQTPDSTQPFTAPQSDSPEEFPGGVKPYEWNVTGEHREAKKIPIPEIDVSSLPPPPVHSKRSESPVSLKASSKPMSRTSTFNSETKLDTLPNAHAGDTSNLERDVPSHDHVRSDKDEEALTGVAGKYENTREVSFPPPPKPHGSTSGTPVHNLTRTSTQNSNSSHNSSQSFPQKKTVPNNSRPYSASVTPKPRGPANVKSQDDKPRAAVLGSYDYNIKVNFEPPPKPFRRTEEAGQHHKAPMMSTPSRTLPTPVEQVAPVTSPPPYNLLAPVQQVAPIAVPQNMPSIPPSTYAASVDESLHSDGSESSGYVDAETDNPLENLDSSYPKHQSSTLEHKNLPPAVKKKPKALQASKDAHTRPVSAFNNELEAKLSKRKAAPPVPAKKESLKKPPVIPAKKPSLKASSSSVSSRTEPVQDKSHSIESDNIKTAAPALAARPKFTMENLEKKMASSKLDDLDRDENQPDDNPFRQYLKTAVPLENDRLHKTPE